MSLLEVAVGLVAKIKAISAEVLARHIQRSDVVKATWLALVSGRPAFFLGSPGTDKTGVVQAMAARITGAVFYDALMPTVVSAEQLLVESTSIEELPTANGGKSIRTRDTLGRAALAHLLFADEIWKADPRVLQTLIDISKGDGVRHEGAMVATPLMAFLAASNELPEPEGNLGAVWSRMTIRVKVESLDRAGKLGLIKARLARDRAKVTGSVASQATLTLADIETLRKARPSVEVPDEIVTLVLDILEALRGEKSSDFAWAWADDRRVGRLVDVLQAHALLEGRARVSKADLQVLEWLLWDNEAQIGPLKAVLAKYVRTPVKDAAEVLDALLSPTGLVEIARKGDRQKSVQAITQCEGAERELARLKGEAGTDAAMVAEIASLQKQVAEIKADLVAVFAGTKKPAAAPTGVVAQPAKGGV